MQAPCSPLRSSSCGLARLSGRLVFRTEAAHRPRWELLVKGLCDVRTLRLLVAASHAFVALPLLPDSSH